MTALTDLLPAGAITEHGEAGRWGALGGEPESVVQPESVEDVARTLAWAGEQGIGVVPAGTGTHFGVRRMHGRFIVLSTDRLTGIDIYEPADLTLTAKSGTRLSVLDAALAPHHQWLPFDPPDVGNRTLGGLVAVGVSGPLWAGYGELRNHVLGATAVCGDGRVLRLGGRVVKNVAGFDLLRPMVGSRGTLAVLTSVCVRLFPVPEVDRMLLLKADSIADLVAPARGAATAPVLPASTVLLSPASELAAGAVLMLRLHGAEATVRAEQRKLERHLGVTFEEVDGDWAPELNALARDHASRSPIVARIAALPSRLADVVPVLERIEPSEIAADTYSGSIRIGLAAGREDSLSDLRRMIESFGGTLGVDRLPSGVDAGALASERSAEELDLTARLERVFDPKGVLWRRPATVSAGSELALALEAQRERLLPCVHCGFCLPACPTYNRLGDEADSPRGRLHLMKAVVEGRLDAGSEAFHTHIDRCLGCRACEPVCPSGVEYGTLLELARETANSARAPGLPTRMLLAVLGSRSLGRLFFMNGRILRGSGIAALGARVLPGLGVFRSARLGLAMLAATAPWRPAEPAAGDDGLAGTADGLDVPGPREPATAGLRVGVLLGCVQQGLFSRVNEATVRVLRANGYEVVAVAGQACCGALHAHGGALDRAREMARVNVDAFEAAGVDWVAVNAAGCGATMREYGTLLERDHAYADRAAALAERTRDVSELLADAGPRPGAEVRCSVAYDHPCHLLHAQGVRQAPLRVLAAVPGVDVRVVENADECCGGAGIYGLTHPDLGGRIGGDKVAAVRRAGADTVVTPNPGCMMQIGAGLRLVGSREGVAHPVELLDESYRRAGYYEP